MHACINKYVLNRIFGLNLGPMFTTRPEITGTFGVASSTHWLASQTAMGVLDRGDRFEYRLTAKGRDLYPVLLALLQWGDRWFSDERGPPVLLTHRPCGHDLNMVVACSHCGDELRLDNSRFTVEATETSAAK